MWVILGLGEEILGGEACEGTSVGGRGQLAALPKRVIGICFSF